MSLLRPAFRYIPAVLLLCLSSFVSGAQAPVVTDFLQVPGPFTVGGAQYNLAWTAHPQPGYYKQEYLVAGDSLPRFRSMLLLEYMRGKTDVALLVAEMVAELKKRQATNPNIRYEVLQKGDEYIIDFLLTENSADGKEILMAERNVYRYRLSGDGKGARGVALFGISKRSYGAEVPGFFRELKAGREVLIGQVGGLLMPTIALL